MWPQATFKKSKVGRRLTYVHAERVNEDEREMVEASACGGSKVLFLWENYVGT